MKKKLLFLFALYLLWLPLFMVQKPVFMLYHLDLGKGVLAEDWFLVMLNGLKLDITVAAYLTVIPFLFVLVSVWLSGAWLKRALKVYYIAVALVVAAIFAVDLGLYGFWGFRLDATVLFYLQSSVKDSLASVPIGEGLFLFCVFLIYMYIIYWSFSRIVLSWTPDARIGRRWLMSFFSLLLGGLLFVAIRGGVTTSTANVGKVYFSKNQFLNHAAINPGFSLLASMSKQQDFATQFNFFPEDECERLFDALISSDNAESIKEESLLNTDRPNILLILLESFSANVIESLGGEPGVTPHLNQLSEEGVLFTQMYANSFRTDRGLVSVLNGYLAQPTTSIMKYPAKSQTLPSLAKSLGKVDYTADMLYGGDINFTNMQSYFFSSGYSAITADRDFPLSTRLSKWGANDDVTFDHLYQVLEKRGIEASPWLTTFLTLSSHEPFEVPYDHLEHPYLNSVAFTDSCVGSFIEKVKQLPMWDDLLVILVSDHGYRYPSNFQEYDPKRYHIPMLWLGGAVKKTQKVDVIANQTDLVATLLRQMNLPAEEFSFSKDVLNGEQSHYAFYTFNNGFGFIDSLGYTVYDNEGDAVLLNRSFSENDGMSDSTRLVNGKVLLQTLYDDLGRR